MFLLVPRSDFHYSCTHSTGNCLVWEQVIGVVVWDIIIIISHVYFRLQEPFKIDISVYQVYVPRRFSDNLVIMPTGNLIGSTRWLCWQRGKYASRQNTSSLMRPSDSPHWPFSSCPERSRNPSPVVSTEALLARLLYFLRLPGTLL